MTTVYISFLAPITQQPAEALVATVFDQITRGATGLYFLFQTQGGDVGLGISLYNIIKGLPVPTTMHNIGGVNSIGNVIFLAGGTRLACPDATFMFHGVGFDIMSPTRLEQKHVREYSDGISAGQKKIASVIERETSLIGEDIDGLFLEAQTKDADFALSKNIVSRIEPVNIPGGAPTVQLVF